MKRWWIKWTKAASIETTTEQLRAAATLKQQKKLENNTHTHTKETHREDSQYFFFCIFVVIFLHSSCSSCNVVLALVPKLFEKCVWVWVLVFTVMLCVCVCVLVKLLKFSYLMFYRIEEAIVMNSWIDRRKKLLLVAVRH